MYVPRLLRAPLEQALAQFPAVLVTGPRQAGKTTFLVEEMGAASRYVTFDDPLDRDFAHVDPNGFLEQLGNARVILDEIQYVPELLPYLKIRIDRERQRHGRWLLTGSQQFGLMADVSESLAGRIAILELLPLSLLELPPPLSDGLATTVWNGGYPEPALAPEKRDLWVSSYVRTYIERDVRQLTNVQDLRTFETFLSLCAAHHGQEVNKARLARDVGVSEPTVKVWLSVLEAAYVTLLLPPFFENFGKRLVKSPKMYFVDPAIVCALTRQPDAASALAGAMGGALFEGLIASEVYKVFALHGKRPDLFFWRSQDGLEVDLLVRAGGRLIPIEVKLTATPSLHHLRPLERFKKLAGETVAGAGVLVCRVAEPRPLPHGNLALPWREFPAWLSAKLEGEG